jgi:nucleoside phosphorylase
MRAPSVLMITGLGEEAEALQEMLRRAGFGSTQGPSIPNLDYERFSILGDGSEGINCDVVSAAHMGRLEAAVTASIACVTLEPSFVFLVGIAGGFRFGPAGVKLSLGDVIVANEIVDVDMRRIYAPPDGMKIRLRKFSLPPKFLIIASEVSSKAWHSQIPPRIARGAIPNVHYGTVVSSESVMGDAENFLSRISQAEFFDNTPVQSFEKYPIGIEMEGAGVALAVDKCAPGVGFLMVKGVSDYADRDKLLEEKFGRHLAKYSAAAFAVSILQTVEFQSLIGRSSEWRSTKS